MEENKKTLTPPEDLPTQDTPQLEPDVKPSKPKVSTRTRTVKPMVEGINAPVAQPVQVSAPVVTAKNDLTESEKQLISGSPAQPQPKMSAIKPVSQLIPEEKNGSNKLLAILAFILVLGGLGWAGYSWYINKQAVYEEKYQLVEESQPAQDNNDLILDQPVQINEIPAATSTASSTPPEVNLPFAPAPSATQLKITKTPTGFLNVRKTPSTSSEILLKANPGDVYSYKTVKSGWYEIELPSGGTGWVISTYIEKITK